MPRRTIQRRSWIVSRKRVSTITIGVPPIGGRKRNANPPYPIDRRLLVSCDAATNMYATVQTARIAKRRVTAVTSAGRTGSDLCAGLISKRGFVQIIGSRVECVQWSYRNHQLLTEN